MEIRNLNTFLKVAALKNFTQAGRELGYSQANISAQIRQLEQEVGAPLFNRIGRTVTLTQYAEELLPYARRIVSTAAQMENLLKDAESIGGIVRVGMVESLFDTFAEQLLPEYHRRFPRVQLEISVDATADLKERIRRGSLDLACVIDDPLPPSRWQVLCSQDTRIVVVANPANPLAGEGDLDPAVLAQQDLILMESTAPYSLRLQAAMARHRVELRPFLTLQSSGMALRLVEASPYVSVLPAYVVSDAVKAGKICLLSFPTLAIDQSVQVIMHRDKVPMPQFTGFASLLEQQLRKPGYLELP
ncbi:MAG: LysR family transcriptional regulator [Oscillospiraceae bacterium]|nr:LysR family transcriptional regulator [Oscillospiraceae bacterium]